MTTLTSAPVSVVTAMALPLIDLIVPTAFTLDFDAEACWVPSFCAVAKDWGAASKATNTTTTGTFAIAMGLRTGAMNDTLDQ